MKELLNHGFKIEEDDNWVVFKKKIADYNTIKVYQNKAWDSWNFELIQKPFSALHDQNEIILNVKADLDWALKATQILEEAGNIF